MSSKDIAISVRDLGKSYTIHHNAQDHSTFAEAALHRLRHPFQRAEKETFWALQDVNFDVNKGDVVGIIGRNGAGKSTLLKVLSRITAPTTGQIDLYGRVGSLLEVGTGFHPELTGRENVYLNGSILGMRRSEINAQFDNIVDFAGVSQFLDTPVKRYSSGMAVRLAFAVAAHLSSEILIVDEVLAVGDAEFQKRCLGKMQDVADGGRTVLFVSHNMGTVQTLCRRGILLRDGQTFFDGAASDAVAEYIQLLEISSQTELVGRSDRRGKGEARLVDIGISTGDDLASTVLSVGGPAQFIFHIDQFLPGLTCGFTVYDQHGHPITHCNSAVLSPEDNVDNVRRAQPAVFTWATDELTLLPGRYRLNVILSSGGQMQDHIEGAACFDVEQGLLRGRPITSKNGYGSVCMQHRWMLAGSPQVAACAS